MYNKSGKTVLFCIEHFHSDITDPRKIDTDYVWDIFHQATNLICEVKGCTEKARWIVNGSKNKEKFLIID